MPSSDVPPPLPKLHAELLTAREAEVVIRTRDLHVAFGQKPILKGLDLEVCRGETLVILGGSGSGKSTFLRSLIGVIPPVSGDVEVLGQDVYDLSRGKLAELRKQFGVLFQSGALFNSMTVAENIKLILREHRQVDEEMADIIVKMKLELVGLRGCEQLMPAELSGGMKKRVGLARALVLDPEIIFYDEPGAGLDPITKSMIDRLIASLAKALSATSVVVTHHINSAFAVADRIVLLHEGRIAACGDPDFFRQTDDPLIRQFVTGDPDGPITKVTQGAGYKEDLLQ